MPIVFTLLGLCVIILCLWVLKKTGFAALRKKFREALSDDAKTFDSSDKID